MNSFRAIECEVSVRADIQKVWDAWGNGGQWEDAHNYFFRAWPKTVLPRLKYSFEIALVDWSNPPQF